MKSIFKILLKKKFYDPKTNELLSYKTCQIRGQTIVIDCEHCEEDKAELLINLLQDQMPDKYIPLHYDSKDLWTWDHCYTMKLVTRIGNSLICNIRRWE